MTDFAKGYCHKCKFETSAECVPRSQKRGYPNCFQSTVTNYDRLISKTPEELAEWMVLVEQRILEMQPALERPALYKDWLDYLKQEAEK